MAAPEMVNVSLPPALLARGFWIYVWKIGLGDGTVLHYVGMTGDTGSYVAGSPLKRAADDLGFNERSNALRQYHERKGCPPEQCRMLDLMAFGPIGDVPEDRKLYKVARGKIAALEKALCSALRAAQYEVLHDDPRCNFKCDESRWDASAWRSGVSRLNSVRFELKSSLKFLSPIRPANTWPGAG